VVTTGPTRYRVQGHEIATPVEVRDASSWFATFAVPANAAQQLIAYSGLEVLRPVPRRALVSLAFVRYVDSDLGPYHEVAVAVLVRAPGTGRRPGALIHQLPVNQAFTMEAGRSIWGFPKWMANIDVVTTPRSATCTLWHDREHVLTLTVGRGVPLPARVPPVDAYSWCGGTRRRTRWEMEPHGVRSRPTGAALVLGDHALSAELKALGLPRPAVATTSIDSVRMRFGPPELT